ncbi:RNA-binding protein hfq [Synechococcus sp. W65.1]|uniref:Hfq-related RNA-binding protein n=1 Tax=Synechococcus sp. W65.1 TaxID=2964526 RepID=UPI0039C3A06D
MTDFDTGIPSVRRLQQVIRDREILEVKLNTGDVFVGQLRWQDPDCLCLADAEGQESLLWRSAIAFVKVRPHP